MQMGEIFPFPCLLETWGAKSIMAFFFHCYFSSSIQMMSVLVRLGLHFLLQFGHHLELLGQRRPPPPPTPRASWLPPSTSEFRALAPPHHTLPLPGGGSWRAPPPNPTRILQASAVPQIYFLWLSLPCREPSNISSTLGKSLVVKVLNVELDFSGVVYYFFPQC